MSSHKRMLAVLALLVIAPMAVPIALTAADAPQPPPAVQPSVPPPVPAPRQFRPMMPQAQCPMLAISSPMNMDIISAYRFPQLNPQQQEKLNALRDSQAKKMDDAASRIQSATWALMQALSADKADATKIQQLAAAASKAEADALKVEVDFWIELRSLLGPEQDKELVKLLQQRVAPSLTPGAGGYRGW